MKHTMKWTSALAIVAAGMGSAANATPTTWVDYIDFRPDRLVTEGHPVIYAHTLEDFQPGVDDVSSYSISFDLYDDNDTAAEKALFSQPGNLFGTYFFNLSGTEGAGWTIAGQWFLEQTGSLVVAISSMKGDFYLGSSTLRVYGDDKTRSVPEPGSLALFGAALLGFGLLRRRRQAI